MKPSRREEAEIWGEWEGAGQKRSIHGISKHTEHLRMWADLTLSPLHLPPCLRIHKHPALQNAASLQLATSQWHSCYWWHGAPSNRSPGFLGRQTHQRRWSRGTSSTVQTTCKQGWLRHSSSTLRLKLWHPKSCLCGDNPGDLVYVQDVCRPSAYVLELPRIWLILRGKSGPRVVKIYSRCSELVFPILAHTFFCLLVLHLSSQWGNQLLQWLGLGVGICTEIR